MSKGGGAVGADRTARDCELDQTALVVIATGERLTPPDSQRILLVADLVREEGAWKVEAYRIAGSGCVPGP